MPLRDEYTFPAQSWSRDTYVLSPAITQHRRLLADAAAVFLGRSWALCWLWGGSPPWLQAATCTVTPSETCCSGSSAWWMTSVPAPLSCTRAPTAHHKRSDIYHHCTTAVSYFALANKRNNSACLGFLSLSQVLC